MSGVDKDRLDEAIKRAQQESTMSWDEISESQKADMRRKLREGNTIDKLKEIAQMILQGNLPSEKLFEAIAAIILGRN